MKNTIVGIGVAVLLAHTGFSQEKTAPLTFEVADVQRSKQMKPMPDVDFKNSKLTAYNMTLKMIVMAAWDLKDDKMLVGAPAWFNTDQFDIVAKAPPDTPDATLKIMAQNLIMERFKMAIHKQDKEMPVYALTVKKDAPKLQPAAGGKSQCPPVAGTDGQAHRSCTNMTMADFALALPDMAPAYLELPVPAIAIDHVERTPSAN